MWPCRWWFRPRIASRNFVKRMRPRFLLSMSDTLLSVLTKGCTAASKCSRLLGRRHCACVSSFEEETFLAAYLHDLVKFAVEYQDEDASVADEVSTARELAPSAASLDAQEFWYAIFNRAAVDFD